MNWATTWTYATAPWRAVLIVGFVISVICYEIKNLVVNHD